MIDEDDIYELIEQIDKFPLCNNSNKLEIIDILKKHIPNTYSNVFEVREPPEYDFHHYMYGRRDDNEYMFGICKKIDDKKIERLTITIDKEQLLKIIKQLTRAVERMKDE